MIYRLLHADREAIKAYWPTLIRPGVVAIKEKCPNAGQWLPEHVRQRIEAGLAGQIFCECHLISREENEAGKVVGFIVINAYNDEYAQVPLSLFVWLVHCTDAPAEEVLPFALPILEQRARDLGLRYVDGVGRGGWERRLTDYGYKAVQTMFRKEVI